MRFVVVGLVSFCGVLRVWRRWPWALGEIHFVRSSSISALRSVSRPIWSFDARIRSPGSGDESVPLRIIFWMIWTAWVTRDWRSGSFMCWLDPDY